MWHSEFRVTSLLQLSAHCEPGF